MSVTYYVALPFVRTEDGVAPGDAQEMPSSQPRSAVRKRWRGTLPCWCAGVQTLGRSGNGQFPRCRRSQNVRRGAGPPGRALIASVVILSPHVQMGHLPNIRISFVRTLTDYSTSLAACA